MIFSVWAALSGENWVLAGIGLALGLVAGGLAGRASARRAIGPRERAFTRRTCFTTGALLGLFLASAVALPPPSRYVAPALLLFIIPALVYRWSVRRLILRRREERELQSPAQKTSEAKEGPPHA